MTQIPFSRINWVDVVAVILLVRMGYIGLRSGLPAELIKLAGAVAAFCLAFRYYQGIGDVLASRTFLGTEWASVLAMVGLAAAGYFAVTRLLRLVERLVKVSFQKQMDQIGGLAAGLVRGALVTSVVLVACLQLPSPVLHESITQHSVSGGAVSQMAPAVYDALTALVRRVQN